MPGLDLTRRVGVTAFDATPAVLLVQGADAAAALDRAEREFLLATAAEAVGGIDWCVDAAVMYAKDREQFGRPIASFEAVAHACVDMLTAFQEVSEAAATPRSPTSKARPTPRPRPGWPRCGPGRRTAA